MIGFGVDSGPNVKDATEASARAVQDALSRSSISIPNRSTCPSPWQILVKLGVPLRPSSSEPMPVDLARLASVLPDSATVMPFTIGVGGLWVAGTDTCGDSNAMCAAVACVTIQRPVSPAARGREVPPSRASTTGEQPFHQPTVAIQQLAVLRTRQNETNNSMDMLAQISEEVRESREQNCSPSSGPRGFQMRFGLDVPAVSSADTSASNVAKKLPPGITAKNNRRQYVQHDYTDHTYAKPTATDGVLVLAGKNCNTVFPVKLHEVLSQVENDGRDHIISWQPHGRSFKIHKHPEFIDLVLPQYCQLLKKSSFLRQLNLYGFNRISVGPDKGAYYHEQFLRGMRFLCRRMARSKINGNVIRSAGNPEQEPNFYTMPHVPLEITPPPAFSSPKEDTEECSDIAPILSSVPETQITTMDRNQAVANHMSFPLKLQTMLDNLEAEDNTDIISWLAHGRGFLVHHPEAFVEELMTTYFRQTKYSSFQRQLHMYSFQRITAGRDKGAYFHEHFLRGKPQLCRQMERTRVNGKGCRKPGNPNAEPNFYQLPPMRPASDVVTTSNERASVGTASNSSTPNEIERREHRDDLPGV